MFSFSVTALSLRPHIHIPHSGNNSGKISGSESQSATADFVARGAPRRGFNRPLPSLANPPAASSNISGNISGNAPAISPATRRSCGNHGHWSPTQSKPAPQGHSSHPAISPATFRQKIGNEIGHYSGHQIGHYSGHQIGHCSGTSLVARPSPIFATHKSNFHHPLTPNHVWL